MDIDVFFLVCPWSFLRRYYPYLVINFKKNAPTPNTITGIPTIDPSTIIMDPVTGVYKAKVINPISGTVKGRNQGYSTFLPDNWTAQQKVDAMNEAYNNRKPVENTRNTYEGITKEGIIMEMYIDENTKQVISSFPKF